MLLWFYGVATGPLAYMARGEDNPGSSFTVFFVQLAYIIMGAMILFGHPSFYDVIEVFVGVMVVAIVATMTFVGIAGRQSAAAA